MRERYSIDHRLHWQTGEDIFTINNMGDEICKFGDGQQAAAEHYCKVLNLEEKRDRYARIATYCFTKANALEDYYDVKWYDLYVAAQDKASNAQRELNELYRKKL